MSRNSADNLGERPNTGPDGLGSGGADPGGADPGGAHSGSAGPGGANPGGVGSGGTGPGGANPGGAESDGIKPHVLPKIGTPTLIFLRHGRTVLNDQNKLQGSTDAELDLRGQEQSRSVGDFIRLFYNVDSVISSPLKRTLETIKYAGFDELPLREDLRLAEIDYGDWECEPVALRASEMMRQWNQDASFAPPGGESLASLFERVSAACEDLVNDSQEQTVLVCTHATPIKAAIVWALGGSPKMIMKIHSHPASISVIAQTYFGRVLVGYNERPESEHVHF